MDIDNQLSPRQLRFEALGFAHQSRLFGGLRVGLTATLRRGQALERAAGALPDWLADEVRVYYTHCRRIERPPGLPERAHYRGFAGISGGARPGGRAAGTVFIFQHAPLSESFCGTRLRKTYAPRCGVRITPHQLRHSCATLLLNAGAPVLTVQTILGHKHIDTTLGYARLYDGTVAADYYRAMAQIERRLTLEESATTTPPCSGQLLALVDSLRDGTLNEAQLETVRTLRAGILALAEHDAMPVTVDTAGHLG